MHAACGFGPSFSAGSACFCATVDTISVSAFDGGRRAASSPLFSSGCIRGEQSVDGQAAQVNERPSRTCLLGFFSIRFRGQRQSTRSCWSSSFSSFNLLVECHRSCHFFRNPFRLCPSGELEAFLRPNELNRPLDDGSFSSSNGQSSPSCGIRPSPRDFSRCGISSHRLSAFRPCSRHALGAYCAPYVPSGSKQQFECGIFVSSVFFARNVTLSSDGE